MVITESVKFRTKGNTDVINITQEVQEIISNNAVVNGSCTVFCVGSTGSITTIEFEPGLKKDMKIVLDRLIPPGDYYHHHETWGDDNGHSHVKSSMLGPSVVVPFVNRKLLLGTWQQIVFIDFDTRSRDREVVVQLNGE